MNTEIVKRLSDSFRNFDKTHLMAVALLKELDRSVVNEMVEIVLYDRARNEAMYEEARRDALHAPQGNYWDDAVPPEQRQRSMNLGPAPLMSADPHETLPAVSPEDPAQLRRDLLKAMALLERAGVFTPKK
jgi:hypothetical protein